MFNGGFQKSLVAVSLAVARCAGGVLLSPAHLQKKHAASSASEVIIGGGEGGIGLRIGWRGRTPCVRKRMRVRVSPGKKKKKERKKINQPPSCSYIAEPVSSDQAALGDRLGGKQLCKLTAEAQGCTNTGLLFQRLLLSSERRTCAQYERQRFEAPSIYICVCVK